MGIPEQKYRHRRRKKRLEDSGKKNLFAKIESLISKYLLRVIGIIFVLASIWYAASSADKLLSLVKGFSGKESVIQPAPGTVATLPAAPVTPVGSQGITGMMVVWGLAISVLIIILFLLANRTRRKEIGRLSVLIFYAGTLLLAGKYGWQVHLLFPLVLLFSLMLLLNCRRLKSTLAFKINVLMAWAFFGIWWGLKIVLGGNHALLFPCIFYASLFFCFFLLAGMRRGFSGYHKSSKHTEIIVVSVNITASFLIMSATLFKLGHGEFIWLFTLLMALVLFVAMYVSDGLKFEFNRSPYLFSGMILLSMVMPLLFRVEIPLLFFGCLSVLLLVYARFSGEQAAVIGSMVGLVIMLMIFLQEWILHLFQAVFLRNILDDQALVYKGILAGVVAIPVLIIDRILLKEADITFSKKWFTRRSYLRLMKGAILLAVYLTGYWLFTYTALLITNLENCKYMAWFCFSALYFIVVLPILAKQKSTYLRPFVWLSIAVMISYPLFIHLTVVEMRNGFLKHASYSPSGFWFHYLAIVLLIVSLWMTAVHFVRVYKAGKPFLHGVWTFIILMTLFLVLSELDHIRIVTGLKRGIRIEDLVQMNRQLPYTIVMVLFSLSILVLGFFRRNRFLRALALVIFAATLIKFLYLDIRSIGGTGRTVLLFSSGIVVLTISFFYRRIRTFFHNRETGHSVHPHHRHHRDKEIPVLPENKLNQNETL